MIVRAPGSTWRTLCQLRRTYRMVRPFAATQSYAPSSSRNMIARLGLAQPRCRLDDRVEHRLQLDGERLITLSTSLVAVWYSSDSVSSRVRACTSSNSRAFSMAITAWSAKVVDQLDLLVGERLARSRASAR